jgi:hypothetical protein
MTSQIGGSHEIGAFLLFTLASRNPNRNRNRFAHAGGLIKTNAECRLMMTIRLPEPITITITTMSRARNAEMHATLAGRTSSVQLPARRILTATLSVWLGLWTNLSLVETNAAPSNPDSTSVRAGDIAFLHDRAARVLDSCKVLPGGVIPSGPTNTTPYALRVPGGTQSYYPAFWIRDAAMMLGGGFIPAIELEGWVRLVAATQPGPEGLRFGRLTVPPFSIPDHITLSGPG